MHRSRKKQETSPLAACLPGLIDAKGWRKKLDKYRIFQCWDEVMEPEVVHHVRPRRVAGSVLWLEVENSAWMQLMHYRKPELLVRINRCGHSFSDLRFMVAERAFSPDKKTSLDEHLKPLPPEQIERFSNMVAAIENESMRAMLTRLWLASQSSRQG
jgi:hypothetical protein